MFQKFKNIDSRFRRIRMASFLIVQACIVISTCSIYYGFHHAREVEGRIYVLANSKVLEAVAADRKDNIPVEARDHIRVFHQLFFSLDPDEQFISGNMDRAFYLADASAKRLYDNLKESGFIAGIISGNISQTVTVDSIRLDMDTYPYHFRCYGTEKLIRATSITTRNLVTQGWLRNTGRSDNNPHGFLIERFEVLDNRNLHIRNR
jgi:conjugative transposon TraK protein